MSQRHGASPRLLVASPSCVRGGALLSFASDSWWRAVSRLRGGQGRGVRPSMAPVSLSILEW